MKLQLLVTMCILLLVSCSTQRNVQSHEQVSTSDNSTLEQVDESDKMTLDLDFFTAMCESLRVQFSADSIKGPGGTIYNPRLETEAEKPIVESSSGHAAHESDSTSTAIHLDTLQHTDSEKSTETVVEVIPPIIWWSCIGSAILNIILLITIAAIIKYHK